VRLIELQLALPRTLYEGVVRSLELQVRESVQPYLRERMNIQQNEAGLTLAASFSGDRGLLPEASQIRGQGARNGSGVTPRSRITPSREAGDGHKDGRGEAEGRRRQRDTSSSPPEASLHSRKGTFLSDEGVLFDERL